MPTCSVINCKNRPAKGINLTFHRYPINDPELLKQWLENMKRESWQPKPSDLICSEHFEVDCFSRTAKRIRLHLEAVPTIFNISSEEDESNKRRTISSNGKEERSPNKKIKQEVEEFVDEVDIDMDIAAHNSTSDPEYNPEEADDDYVPKSARRQPKQVKRKSLSKRNSRKADVPTTIVPNVEVPNSLKDTISVEKFFHLADGRTFFEFNRPAKKVILQLQKLNDSCDELKSQNLEELIDCLKSRQLISSDTEALLEAFGEFPKSLEKVKTANNQKKWTKDVQNFASALYLSPKAYDLVGTVFKLPDRKQIQERLTVESFLPGFTQESLTILKEKIPNKNPDKICCIMMDFVDLRKQHSYDNYNDKWIGHVNFGANQDVNDCDEIPLANELVMFTAVGLGSNWKLPFGYFLSKGFDAQDLHCLVREAILVLENCGLNVRALVCDGSRNTVKMGKLLGCKIHTESLLKMNTSFPHPLKEKQKILLVFSFQRIFKLLKHLLEDKGSLKSSTYGLIKWKYFNLLFYGSIKYDGVYDETFDEFVHLQRVLKLCQPGFTYAVSNAFSLAEESGLDEFTGCDAATNFSADMNRAFDVLNSRNPFSEDKPPLNLLVLIEQLESTYNMMKRIFEVSLSSGKSVARGERWMSIALLTFTLKSVATLASELLNQRLLLYFPTYRLNLDHSDMVLRCIQKRGGWDCIPTAEEFKNGYEKLLTEAISISAYSETFNNDFEGEDLTVNQRVLNSNQNEATYKLDTDQMIDVAYVVLDSEVIAAKCIVRYLAQDLCCVNCVTLMLDEDPISGKKLSSDHFTPSRFVLRILQTSERFVLLNKLKGNQSEEQLVIRTFCEFMELSGGLRILTNEHVDEEPYHVICLIKAIIRTFVKFKMQSVKKFCDRKVKMIEDCR